MDSNFRDKACTLFKLANQNRRGFICLFCKYQEKYNSHHCVRHDEPIPTTTIIVPQNVPDDIIEKELVTDYPRNYCYNPEEYSNFLIDFHNDEEKLIQYIKRMVENGGFTR